MTQNNEGLAYTPEEVRAAEAQEQAELNASQKAYLQQRVVTLRVQNNRLSAEVEDLKAELERMRTTLPAVAPGGEGPGTD